MKQTSKEEIHKFTPTSRKRTIIRLESARKVLGNIAYCDKNGLCHECQSMVDRINNNIDRLKS